MGEKKRVWVSIDEDEPCGFIIEARGVAIKKLIGWKILYRDLGKIQWMWKLNLDPPKIWPRLSGPKGGYNVV